MHILASRIVVIAADRGEKMQAIMEAAFDAVYLSFAIVAGIFLVVKGKGSTTVVLFGIMSMILGIGDSFHLVPRVYALFTTGLEANVHSLGIGKLVTSVTMTVFYILLYFIYRMIYEKKSIALDVSMVFLAVLRIVLCLLPGNRWTSADAPLSYGIARNIPFAAIGILLIWLFHRDARKKMDDPLRNMDVAISLSFIRHTARKPARLVLQDECGKVHFVL